MVNITVFLLEDVEDELGMGDLSPDDIAELGDRLQQRFHDMARAIKILEKNGWKWSAGAKDIYFEKDITKNQAVDELKKLKVPQHLFKGFLHIDNVGKPL